MSKQATCPHCGSERRKYGLAKYYECWTRVDDSKIDPDCYERQIAAQAAEIVKLKNVIKDAIPILEYHWEVIDDGVFYKCPELENAKAALGLIKGEMSWAEDNGIDIGDADDFDQDVEYKVEHLWQTKDDKTIKVSEMTNQHLYYAYKLTGAQRLQREMVLRLFMKNFGDVK